MVCSYTDSENASWKPSGWLKSFSVYCDFLRDHSPALPALQHVKLAVSYIVPHCFSSRLYQEAKFDTGYANMAFYDFTTFLTSSHFYN